MYAKVFLDDVVRVPVPEERPKVRGHVADELNDGETYELVTCTACGGTHLMNPKTGRLLEQAKK